MDEYDFVSGTEEWRPVREALAYEVSSEGRVRNKRTGRILIPSYNRAGTPQVVLMDAGFRLGRTIPALVEDAFGED